MGYVVLGVVVAAGALMLSPLPPDRGVALAQEEKSESKPFKVDKVHSAVLFGIKHLGVGYTYGRFNQMGGSFMIDPANPQDSFVDMTINVESIDTGDDGRDKHLRGPDFFNVKVFPEATFKSTSVRRVEEGLEMIGELTIHGVKKRVTVPVEFVGEGSDPWGGYRSGFHTEFEIKRSDFGIRYMPEALGDDIRMIVSIEGVRR